VWAGAPGVLNAIEGVYKGLQPSYGVAASASGWLDLNGDGLPEFVVTPSWIDRFSIDLACFDFTSVDLVNEAAEHTLDSLVAHQATAATPGVNGPARQWHSMGLASPMTGATENDLNVDGQVSAGQLPVPAGPPGPIGMPINYETTTASSRGFGFTLPIGSLVSAGISSVISGSWIPIASAAPGLTVDSFTPRNAPGYTLSVRGPSTTGVLQGLGSIATSTKGSSASSVYDFIMSTINANFDLTFVTTTTNNRSETRAQLMDINADGLPDYLLYTTANEIVCTKAGPTIPVPPGTLVVYLNSPTGFTCPRIINSGFSYRTTPPDLTALETQLATATALVEDLIGFSGPPADECATAPDVGALCAAYWLAIPGRPDTATLPLDQACKTAFCFLYEIKLAELAHVADQVVESAGSFIKLSNDTIPPESDELSDISTLIGFLRGWGLSLQLHPDLASVDATTAAARALLMDLGYVARTIQHMGYSSHINVVAAGKSELDGAAIGQTAAGIAAQTRGFVDLNGDGLPDYVITDDRESPCDAGQWEVFWGTGTSSISAGRAFLPQPACIDVPAPPADLVQKGYSTLPLNVDFVLRRPTGNAQSVDTVSDSFISLNDINRDGRPDIVIAGDTWNADASSQVWHVFLNTGQGFEMQASLNISSPMQAWTDQLETAACANPDLIRSCIDVPLSVPYPAIRSTHAVGNLGMARDTSETHAAMIDIDGDGTPEVVRRVHTIAEDTSKTPRERPKREGLLVWRRADVGGPQDLMFEDRYPLDGYRRLIEYKPASSFQWNDALPNGAPPQMGHQSLAGVNGQLVRSITNEPLAGRTERRTQQAYDYKSPFFDMATRMFAGFALKTTISLDSTTGQPIEASVANSQRNAQPPNGLPGITQARSWIPEHGTGAQVPVKETLTSYGESQPSTLFTGSGGLKSIFSAPTDVLTVEYPSNLKKAAILDIGFDGRKPFRDRAAGRDPLSPPAQDLRSTCTAMLDCQTLGTGGSVVFTATSTPITYASPHPMATGGTATPVGEVTIEAWVRPTSAVDGSVIAAQSGAYRLHMKMLDGTPRWSLDVGGVTRVTATEDIQVKRWQHLVAAFDASSARIFVNGHVVGSEQFVAPVPTVSGNFVIGCDDTSSGTPSRCFVGEIGELRIYPEAWTAGPRTTETTRELQLDDVTRSDFGQAQRILDRNDLATNEDDLVTEYQYAWSNAEPPVLGLVSSEAKRGLKADDSSGLFLSYGERLYDGLPFNVASAGNQTRASQFDGLAQAFTPTTLNVVTKMSYDPNCPGQVSVSTDAKGFETKKIWDDTCTFTLENQNALGHTTLSNYYGVSKGGTILLQPGNLTGPYGSFALQGHYGQSGEFVDPNGARRLTTYDDWGRTLAVWAPLDREDRPGLKFEYADAICQEQQVNGFIPGTEQLQIEYIPISCDESSTTDLDLRSPPRVTTSIWDDHLRRCQEHSGSRFIKCSDPSAVGFVDETSTGAYRVTHVFGDGQAQSQVVNDHGQPDWNISGIVDYDVLGKAVRSYRVRYLPRSASTGVDACPSPGNWCDSARLNGDPLRANTASVQTAYDAQGRVVRIYGPTVPRCNGDPSAIDAATGEPACDSRIPRGPDWDVTSQAYPVPGETLTTDANGVPTKVERNNRGLITTFQEYSRLPSGSFGEYSKVEYVYDQLGQLKSVSDQDGNVSTNEYDALSRVIATTDPDLGRRTYAYDLNSELTEQIVATGEKTLNKFDALGRITRTDFLRPKPGPAGPPSQAGPVAFKPPYECAVAPGPLDPPQLIPSQIGPRPPTWEVLKSSSGDVSQREVRLTLPFDLSLELSSPKPELVSSQALVKSPQIIITKGTPLFVSPNGKISVGHHGVSDGPEILGTLFVFATDLTLAKDGLRSAITGQKGSRELTIEWNGVTASDDSRHVIVRAILAESGSPIRYEFQAIPKGLDATVGLQFQTRDTPLVSLFSAGVEPGSGLALGRNLPAPTSRLSCKGNPQVIEVPVNGADAQDAELRLRYRVFSDCGDECGKDYLQIGYRDPFQPSIIRDLAIAKYNRQRFSESGNGNPKTVEAIDIMLPQLLRGKKFNLIIRRQVDPLQVARPFVLDLGAITVEPVIYEPEERVLRTYDSSEPPYFTKADHNNSGKLVEAQPEVNFSFDVPGLSLYRSESGAQLECDHVNTAKILDRNIVPVDVIGASGRGIQLTNNGTSNTVCSVSRFTVDPRNFTTELWVRPESYPTKRQTIWNLGLAPATSFSISILPVTGQISCNQGPGKSITSNVSLPTDAWSHLALAFDGATLRCLVNGVQQRTALPISVVPLKLDGAQVGDRTGSVTIDVDEIRVVSTSRSNDEILSDALRPLSVGPPTGNLMRLDFAHPLSPANVEADQSKANNNALWLGGRIVPGIQGMSFDTGTGPLQTVGGQVRVEDSPTMRLADSLTAELWLKTRNHKKGPSRLMGKWAGAAHPGWRLDLEPYSGHLRWEVVTESIPNPQHQVFVTFENVNDDVWHHVAATYDGHRLRVFIDGLPAHRWCSQIESQSGPTPCTDPPAPTQCSTESIAPGNPDVPQTIGNVTPGRSIGDAVCLSGKSVDNNEPLLIANDGVGAEFDGFIDEIRVSNYAKREFEVAASARVASAFTQTLGRETILRNQLPVNNDLESQVAREQRAYDTRGRLSSQRKHVRGQISAEDFYSRTVPDSLDRRSSLEYPHGEVAVSGFDLAGTENSFIGYAPLFNQSSSQMQVYVQRASSTVTGKPAQTLYGNSVSTSWSYENDPTPTGGFGRDLLHSATVSNPNETMSNRVYDWDVLGNLQTLNDNALDAQGAARFAALYGYDDLRRVISAAITISGRPLSATADPYFYDPLGNLTTKENATQKYGRANLSTHCAPTSNVFPHALTLRIAGSSTDSYCYDNAGRLTGSAARRFSYYARGKVSQVTDSNGNPLGQYSYDGNGNRVKKVEGPSTQVIPFDFYREIQPAPTSGMPTTYEAMYSAGGQFIARREIVPTAANPQNVWWYSDDHLGGTNFLTSTSSGEVAASRAYYRPFGEFATEPALPPSPLPAQPTPQTDKSGNREFTSKELDATGLYDYGARFYDPQTGRFIIADDVTASGGARALNRYCYADNNPLRLIDPSGHQSVDWQRNTPADLALKEKMIALGALPPPSAPKLQQFRERALVSEQMAQEFREASTGVKVLASAYLQYMEVATLPLTFEFSGPADATGLAFEELGSASLLDKGFEFQFRGSRAARYAAEDLHYVLLNSGEKAFNMRTTNVLRAVNPETGEVANIFTTYPQTTGMQQALAERMGIQYAPVIEGAHAEGSSLAFARSQHLLPLEGGVSRNICPMCRLNIEAVHGGALIDPREYILPEFVGGSGE
jgi:RHS repeat-associated protein